MKSSALLVLLSSSMAFANVDTLIIGDSHVVGDFGGTLHKLVYEHSKENTRTVALAGASPHNFVASGEKGRTLSYGFADRKNGNERIIKGGEKATLPELGNLLEETNPNRIVIELGDNFADYKNPSANVEAVTKREVNMILEKLKQTKADCYWVTPTWTDKPGTGIYKKNNERLQQVIAAIKKSASPRCTVIDSTNIGIGKNDISTVSDGIHFNSANGSKWATAVSKRLFELEAQKQTAQPSQKATGKPTGAVN